ncbi:magnesium transporter [Oceanobacillus indicireducens]|uniref:CBS domain-containing protein n=1 Tax=Oceanobacillus indicireducens TaxID=1004261 RepID=A0A917Y5G8_9BACI|nr:CBS domain-containing protein [Oceanobacillus indicireducens]GGN67245.1 hypothetical protein GCM10007971_37910 [Oceanobacillus indicireducens]
MFRLDKQNRERYTKNIINALYENNKEEFRESYLELHPSDQVDIFITLDKEGRERVYMFLEPKEFAVIFSGLYFIHQQVCIEELSDEYSSEMFNHMFTDDTVNFLKRINQAEAKHILDKMEKEKAGKIQMILDYDLETAGAVRTDEYITAFPEETAEDVLAKIRREGSDAEIVYYTYVIDRKGYLKGVVSLKKLIMADPTDAVEDMMHQHIVSVLADMGQEDVGKIIQKYDLLAVPVVTEQNRLLGIITVDDAWISLNCKRLKALVNSQR